MQNFNEIFLFKLCDRNLPFDTKRKKRRAPKKKNPDLFLKQN